MSVLPVHSHNFDDYAVFVDASPFGRGVFADRDFRAGEPLLLLFGPVITFDEAILKGQQESYALQIGPRTYIDTAEPGCYVNHSCTPNAGIIDGFRLTAIRDIAAGTEILYDYSTTMQEDHWTMLCRCGTADCRGLVLDFALLPRHLQQKYLSAGIVQPYIASGSPWFRRASIGHVRRY